MATDELDVNIMPIASAEETASVKAQLGMPVAPLTHTLTALTPGIQRWPVKTGTDDDITKVKSVVVPATVEELVRAARPAGMPDPATIYPAFQSKRAVPVETTIWQVEADIVGIKLETDGDYHLVLQGASGEFMVAEIPTPNPPFVKSTSPLRGNIKQARAAIDTHFSKIMHALNFFPMGKATVPAESFTIAPQAVTAMTFGPAVEGVMPQVASFKTKVTPTKVRITGVGFFDNAHGQTGDRKSVV